MTEARDYPLGYSEQEARRLAEQGALLVGRLVLLLLPYLASGHCHRGAYRYRNARSPDARGCDRG